MKRSLIILFFLNLSYFGSCMLTGGWKKVDTTDNEVKGYALASIQELDLKENSLCSSCFVQLKSAHVQVVSGLKYKFTVVKGTTSCNLKSESLEIEQCSGKEESFSECVVDLWIQPWLKSQQVTESNCKAVSYSPRTPENDVLSSYEAFENFKEKYNKQYSEQEEEMRYAVFHQNMKKAQEMNKHELGTATYGASALADLTMEEFRNHYTSGRWDVSHDSSLVEAEIPSETPPDSWDWRDHNVVSEVKNQGSCGSCWAFSVTGNVEGQWAIKKGNLTSLSEQELVDCDKLDDGCNGGLPTNAYKEIIRLGGLESESHYPYEGQDDKCEFNRTDVKVKINGALNISRDENDMAAWLWKNGPISIGINAMAMQFYLGGISHPWSIFCAPDNLDHGVLIVGYGIENGWFGKEPYWIIKNSWGSSWGKQGYYYLYRGTGACGVNQMPTSAIVN